MTFYSYSGLLTQVTEPDHWGKQNYHCEFRFEMFPTRVTLVLADLDRARAWFLGNVFIDFRSAQNVEAIPIPGDKLWRSNVFDAFRGKLKRMFPLEDEPTVRSPMTKFIFVDLGVSWYPAHLTISWSEGAGSTFQRITTRSAPGTGWWEEIPFDTDLYKLYSPREKPHSDRDTGKVTPDHGLEQQDQTDGSESSDRASTCDDPPTEPIPNGDHAPFVQFQEKGSDHGRRATEYVPYYTNDGVCINPLVQIPIPPEENIPDREATSGNSASEDLDKTVPGQDQGPSFSAEKNESKVTPSRLEKAEVITPERSEPFSGHEAITLVPAKAVSPTGTPPRMVTPKAKTSTVDLEKNLYELQACIGQPLPDYSEVLRRQMLARDLRLDPSLYNWMVFGIAPGTSPHDVRAPLGSRELEEDPDDTAQG